MQWMVWLVAIAALGAAVLLFLRLRDERARHAQLADEHADALAEIEQRQANEHQILASSERAVFGPLAGSVAARIESPLSTVGNDLEQVIERLERYRGLVKAYDNAVQYCLQPVEMIFGADKAGLDQLVKHVEDARRKLFSARAELEKSAALTEARERLVATASALARSGEVVRGLREATRSDAGELEVVDFNAIVDAALGVASASWDGRIEIVREFADLPKARAHAAQVTRAFVHLALNAADAIDGRGRITVQTKSSGPRAIEIAFSDSGKGIDDDVLPNIFEPFFSTRTRAAGLGLAHVRGIVKAHGGSVNVRTTPGAGSTFTVTLPTEPVAAPIASSAPA